MQPVVCCFFLLVSNHLPTVELGSCFFEQHLGGGLSSDIQGQSMAYPKAGEIRRFNLLREALSEVCSRILRLHRGKWLRPRLCA